MKGSAMPRRRLFATAAMVALIAVVSSLALAGPGQRVEPVEKIAETPSEFDPGMIISDFNFYNPAAMTEAEIQTFLEARNCRPRDASPCLSDYRETTTFQPGQGEGHCTAYSGAPKERASRIIAQVAEACTISPRVLLVILQKEQSLLTRPSEGGYLRATGYGCPDSADCNAEYFGFFNQVYNAAWQFRQYSQSPKRAIRIGTVNVGFNPDAACGAEPVRIRNQATANLYNYTPYQPNKAALAHPGTNGDACSTFGNLNFWIFYNHWFGASDTEGYPSFFAPCLNFVGGQPCVTPELIPAL